MKDKTLCITVSCLMVVSLLLASCIPVVTDDEDVTPPQDEEVEPPEEETVPPEEEETVPPEEEEIEPPEEEEVPSVPVATEPSTPSETSEQPASDNASTPEPSVQKFEVIRDISESSELIERKYKWVYADKEWTWDLQIPEPLYDYYKGTPRPPTKVYSIYVTHPWDDEYIYNLVSRINEISQREGFTDLQKVEFTTAFVQSLPYTPDIVSTPYDEYPRFPLETLVDNGGDCEDTSILLTSLLYTMGFDVLIFYFPGKHIAVGILGDESLAGWYWMYEEKRYYYIETTYPGWEIGQVPDEFHGLYAEYQLIVPAPILTHRWTVTAYQSYIDGVLAYTDFELEVTVQNLGSDVARDVLVWVGFDVGEDLYWNTRQSQSFDVPVGQQVTVKFDLQPPSGKHTRFKIQIVDDGYAVNESCSEWYDT